jgi:hypothetical protein
MGVTPVNKGNMFQMVTAAVIRRAGLLALAAAAALQMSAPAPAGAVDPLMHTSVTTGSTNYGTWGDNYTCGTCHRSNFFGGNAKGVAPQVDGKTVNFNNYLSYGVDGPHATSDHICEVCHTKTAHHRYNNSGANHHGTVNCTGCHLHSQGFKKDSTKESSGGTACDGCHSDLYINAYGWGMHSTTPNISYRHFMDNALTGSDPSLTGGQVKASFYSTDIPDSLNTNPKARRCLMCHVDHDMFNGNRAANLRQNARIVPNGTGTNRDDTLCLSCHTQEKTKAYAGPNGETKALPIPFPKVTYTNATSVLNFSTHGYPITSTFKDGSVFQAICTKCHNDSIGKNGETQKSYKGGQTGTYKFGEHNSTLPGRFAVFSTDFYQRVLKGTTLIPLPLSNGIQISPSPGWLPDQFKGHFLVVTAGDGSNQRSLVTGNTADTVTVQIWPQGINDTSAIDITDDNIPVDNTCFSCHSKNGQGKSAPSLMDWYNQKPMSDKLAQIFDVFTGDMGQLPANVRNNNSVTVYLKLGTWSSASITGFVLKMPGGRQAITSMTVGPVASGNATYPYSYTFTLAGKVTSAPGAVELLKPASHPLDTNARHESDERMSTVAGWNVGDQGTSSTANSATAATQITDTKKLWSGSEFKDQIITFPNVFANGNLVTSKVTGGGAGIVQFSPPVNGLTTTGGDSYFIGKRHVSCADCHNPHASFKNPEGKVSSADPTHLADSGHVNIPGWYNDIWKGYLLKVRKSTGEEQIRFIIAFDNTNGTYQVSLPWNTTPTQNDEYEVLMGDKWSSVAQSGGRAGSGSSGQWGVVPTGWRTPKGFGNITGALGVRVIENVFDNMSSTGLRGSTIAGQRDLCVRCHSSFAYGNATPMTPSGGPGTASNPSNARSTDIMKEFNPANQAHHAVYSRGRNQPITATGDVDGGKSYYNPYWPAFGATAGAPYSKPNLGAANDAIHTVSIDTSGTVTFAATTGNSPNIPATVQPGWFIYINAANGGAALTQGATKGWFEVMTVDSQTQITVSPKPKGTFSGSSFKLTAGLGNNFVAPFGPWSILRCTDCHGSTKTDPVGPHASVNKWLIKALDTDLSFDWFDGSSVVTRKPNTGATGAIFCFNCHRRDVYGDSNNYTDNTTYPANTIAYRSFPRAVHAGASTGHPDALGLKGMYNDDAAHIPDVGTLVWGDIFCRHCHAGDKVGGIHGTNAIATRATAPNLNRGQGKRFLNGATWTGYNMPASGVVSCYTQANASSVSSCAPAAIKPASTGVLYGYTSARY